MAADATAGAAMTQACGFAVRASGSVGSSRNVQLIGLSIPGQHRSRFPRWSFKTVPLRTDEAFLLFLGVVMKEIKTRYAATLQLYIGLWWNSVTRTLELEDSKRDSYLHSFDAASTARTLTLREVQSLAGRFQRASLTFPPGGYPPEKRQTDTPKVVVGLFSGG